MVVDNYFLGSFTLNGIAPARRKVSKISTTFSINVNGILTVGAVDRQSGIYESKLMVVYSNMRLSV